MKDRFNLESDITALFSTVDDLRCVADMMYDSNIVYTQDKQHTILHGIAEVLDAKIERLHDTFCQMYKLNQYTDDEEVLALRERFFNACNKLKGEDSE